MKRQWTERVLTALVLLLMGAGSALNAAQAPTVQDGWLAWQGCWRSAQDAKGTMACIVPDGDGARLVTVVDGNVRGETRIIADGQARPVSEEGCKGTEQARWSQDQRRLFISAQMTCGEKITRNVTGIMAMKWTTEFVSVQGVRYGEQVVARTQQYRAVNDADAPKAIVGDLAANRLARESARYAASEQIDLADVTEAVQSVHADVVSDWLAASGQQFALTGKQLLTLAAAGVPTSVIDVMVAVSNPEHFAVRTAGEQDEEETARNDEWWRRDGRGANACLDAPWYYPGAYTYGYAYNNYRCGAYASGYGGYYSPWQYGGGYGWYNGGTIIVVKDGESADKGRVTRNGYTSTGSKGKARARDDSSRSPSYTPSSSTGSSSTPSSSSGSSSGSSSSTARTAKPRDK